MNVLPDIEMPMLKEEIEEIDEEVKDVKPVATMEDIFQNAPVMKEVVVPKENPIVITGSAPMKKKRILSEDHKQKLNAARVKALEVRRANAKEKKELKELEKKAKQKKVDDLKKYIGEDVPVPVKEVVKEVKTEVKTTPLATADTPTTPATTDTPATFSSHMHLANPKKYLTQEDVEEISIQAIAGYEKIRKGRKALKKEENEKVKAQEEVRELLRKTIQPRNITYGQEGYFNDCF